jgi:hypothetical protein
METAFEMLRVFNKYGLMLEKAVVNAIFVMWNHRQKLKTLQLRCEWYKFVPRGGETCTRLVTAI